MGPNWSLLPEELVLLISDKIVFKEQYDNLRLVCPQWRHACPPKARHLIGQIPWMWIPTHNREFSVLSTLSFYDFSESRRYNIHLPCDVPTTGFCYSRGWILFMKGTEFSLMNPVTGELKSGCLPSLSTPAILAFPSNKNTENKKASRIVKFILTSSLSDEKCVVVAEFNYVWGLGFCKIGDSSWTILNQKTYNCKFREIEDFKYKNELLYVLGGQGQITIYNLRDLSLNILINNLRYAQLGDDLYLVIGEGDLDGVPLVVRRALTRNKEYGFEVCKYTNEKGRSRWKRVRNIGKVALLVSECQCEIVLLDNIQFNGWEENHIVYCRWNCFESSYVNIEMVNNENGYVKEVSIENGSVKEVAMPISVFDFYGMCWFTPSLC